MDSQNTVQMNAKKIINIDRANNCALNFYIEGSGPAAVALGKEPVELSHEYYNLFVTENESFKDDAPFLISHEHLLQREMDPDLIRRFSTLSEEALEEICSFPCIFTCKKEHYGQADPDIPIHFGYIRKIKNLRSGVKIYPGYIRFPSVISQLSLHNSLAEFDLWGDASINELDHVHWSIKRLNLMERLLELNLITTDHWEDNQ
ncbi:MAG: hypothetical protein KBT01_00365 [Clostridiales bacterium]|nr:hypothetical protein [Candidatus Blautia equi]